MFLLPNAERVRQVAALGLFLCLGVGLAVWPVQAVSQSLRWLVQPIAQLVSIGVQSIQAVLNPNVGSTGVSAESEPQISTTLLLEVERALGNPPAAPGIAWLEVPVWKVDEGAGLLSLAAGQDFALAAGQAVVFGSHWVGRIIKVENQRATVRLWTSPGARTGVRLVEKNQITKAVTMGRGTQKPPLVRWIDPSGSPHSGAGVFWRATEMDSPALRRLDFSMGRLLRQGNELRGSGVWAIKTEFPAGAEGRVWVAAGAVGDSLVAEPGIHTASLGKPLHGDGVLFGNWKSVFQLTKAPAKVIESAGQLQGEVLRQSGRKLWFLAKAPSAWGSRAIALTSEGEFHEDGRVLFSRGGQGIPRGFLLGVRDSGPPSMVGNLRSLARVEEIP